MVTEDCQTIAQVLSGQTGEFRRIVERYEQPIFRFAYNMIGNRHDAEDVVQEVFVAAFDGLRSYDSKRSLLLTWLFTIARNRCINRLKRRQLRTTDAPTSAICNERPEADAIRQEFWEELDTALSELPLDQKAVFVLAEIEQLSYAEIAEIEEATLGTVKSRLHRAKQKLRVLLGASGEKN